MRHVAHLVALLLTASLAHAAGELPERDAVVRAGRIITMDGPDLVPGTLLIRDGRFVAVGGADLKVPPSLPVIDASTRVVMPGFIEAHGSRGLDRAYERRADASFVRVTDGMNPVSLEIEDARRNGITTLLVAPDARAFLGGRSAIIHPQGLSIDRMIVKRDAALTISLIPSQGSSRMGHLAKLRALLRETRRQMDERAKRSAPSAEPDASKEALESLLADRLPARVTCATAEDVAAAFALGREFGFHVQPVLGPGAWRSASLLRANQVPAIVTPVMESWERQPDGSLLRVHLPRVLHEAGVAFALTTDPSELGAQHPWYQAALCVREGIPRDVALAAITRVPARMLGFGRSKGIIAVDADADFLILSADPLSADAWVDEAFVRGARIYDRATDDKLRRLQESQPEPPLAVAEVDDEDPNEGDDGSSSAVEEERRWPLPAKP